MAKFYSIATSAMTAKQDQALKDALKGYKWWHWLPNYWLVRSSDDASTAGQLRDKVKLAIPGAKCLVLDIVPNTWASLGLPKEGPGRDWLRKTWPPECDRNNT